MRKKILQAAARLFRDRGYAATTLRAIAADAHMKAGSIYYHFSSKDEILHEVLEIGLSSVYNSVREAVDSCGKDATHRDRVNAAIQTHLRVLLSKAEFTSANLRVYGQLSEEIKERHRQKRREYGRYWDELLLEVKEAGELRADMDVVPLRQFVLGALNSVVDWFNPELYSVDVLADRFCQLLCDGIWVSANKPALTFEP